MSGWAVRFAYGWGTRFCGQYAGCGLRAHLWRCGLNAGSFALAQDGNFCGSSWAKGVVGCGAPDDGWAGCAVIHL